MVTTAYDIPAVKMSRSRIATSTVTGSMRDLPTGSSVTVLFNGTQWGATILRRKPQSADVEYAATSTTPASFEFNIALGRITLVAAPETKVSPKKRRGVKITEQRGGRAVTANASGAKRRKSASGTHLLRGETTTALLLEKAETTSTTPCSKCPAGSGKFKGHRGRHAISRAPAEAAHDGEGGSPQPHYTLIPIYGNP